MTTGARSRGGPSLRHRLSKTLGRTAREARLRAGLTQADVAERLGHSQDVYGRLERGLMLPSILTLRRLCLVLHLPADRLLGLASAHPPLWTRSPPSERDSPQVRRLLRSVRELSASRLRVLSVLVATFRRRAGAPFSCSRVLTSRLTPKGRAGQGRAGGRQPQKARASTAWED